MTINFFLLHRKQYFGVKKLDITADMVIIGDRKAYMQRKYGHAVFFIVITDK